MFLISISVSLDAVPFPIAIASILYASHSELIFFIAPILSFFGGCGYIVSLYFSLPCASKQTILHPVLKPGSIAKTRFSPIGDPNNNCFRFFAKTSMAASSALSLCSSSLPLR